jgi:hypothetical protein
MKSLQFRIEAFNIFNHAQILRRSTCRRKHRQHDLRRRHQRSAAADRAGRREILLLEHRFKNSVSQVTTPAVTRSVFCFQFLAMGVQWCGFEQTDPSPIVGDNLDAL